MPANQKVAMHSDFTIEQHDEIKKNIRVVGKKEAFWYDLCQHDKMPKADNLKYRHQILLDPKAVHVLTEYVTPDPTSVAAIQFSVAAFNIGSWFKYTRESMMLNKDSIVEMGGNQLAHERLYDLETIRGNAYRGTTCALTRGQNETAAEFLLKAKTRLKKNGAKPIRGTDFLFVAPGEIINGILIEIKDELKAVPAGEEIILKGVLGRAYGFQFAENDDDSMYYTETTGEGNSAVTTQHAVALLIGRNKFGELPVVERSYNGTNDTVSSKGCEADKNDPMGNWGFISSRVDGVCAVLADEACVLKYAPSITLIEADRKGATLDDVVSQSGYKIKQVKVKPNQARTDVEVEAEQSAAEAEYDD